jgi:Rod binding protein
MSDATANAALAAEQSKQGDLVALKQQVDRLRGDLTPGTSKKQKLRKACNDFEAIFISKMWEKMRSTLPKDGYLHSPQEDMYTSMFDRDFAEKMAADGGIGLGDMLYSQLQNRLDKTVKTTKSSGAASVTTDLTAKHNIRAKQAASTKDESGVRLTEPTPLDPATLKMPTQSTQLKRKEQSAQTTSVSAASPKLPASVPGEVMAQVENLARRIEAAFDSHTQKQTTEAQTSAYATSQAAAPNTGQSLDEAKGSTQNSVHGRARTGGYTMAARISALGIPVGRNLAEKG